MATHNITGESEKKKKISRVISKCPMARSDNQRSHLKTTSIEVYIIYCQVKAELGRKSDGYARFSTNERATICPVFV